MTVCCASVRPSVRPSVLPMDVHLEFSARRRPSHLILVDKVTGEREGREQPYGKSVVRFFMLSRSFEAFTMRGNGRGMLKPAE